jgi:small ligand-binding sensory domain FIST
MRFAAVSVVDQNLDAILAEVAKNTLDRLGESVDVALVFPSTHFAKRAEGFARDLKMAIGARVMIGCCGEGVIGPTHEIEDEPAIAVVAGKLPGVEVEPFFLSAQDLMQVARNPMRLHKSYDPPFGTKFFVMLADPFSVPMDRILTAFNMGCEGIPIIGGMASGARQPGESVLFMNDRVVHEGLVGLTFRGPIDVDIIVSQGCRPIGPVFEVTAATNNIIDSLGGESPLERIGDLVDQLDEDDRQLLHNGLFIGRAIDSGKETLGRGDFLIRGVIGADNRSGAIAVGDVIEAGERVQFHLRDAKTAREDLEMMLSPHALFGDPSGAFLFSCNGRGTHLYQEPDGDISAITGFFRGLDVAGFFCAGEIGPVGGKNFLHGHTASLALIRPESKDPKAPA